MSDGFLSRWSRRKQAAERGAAEVVPVEPAVELPAIETLGASSDYSAFLQKGVSALVQQAALQKAWTSDQGIAEFRGMADYDWDFNAAGYGRLRVTDSVVELLKGVLGTGDGGQEEAVAAVDGPSVRLSVAEEAVAVEAEVGEEEEAVREAAPLTQRHGSAMPS